MTKQLVIVPTGPWNENQFRVCWNIEEVEDCYIANFAYREDAELFVAAKKAAAEPEAERTELKCPKCDHPTRVYTGSLVYDVACKCPL